MMGFAVLNPSYEPVWDGVMDRRAFLNDHGRRSCTAGLATPAISQRAAARTLRFVPQADLANFDPIWNTPYIVRNAAALVWDMLYGVDANLQPQRQMVESEEVSADGLTWTFRLRPGLEIPRRRAGAGEGRGREPRPLGGARHHGPDDQGDRERACRRR